ncbi:MAG: hypothetical protein IJA02_05540 [Clostridia bacterium]|nr:hypothetical protein [Clostridia bacterium]
MKGKSLILAAVVLAGAALLFTACNKQNGGTGQYVFVTDLNGVTVVDKDGNPVTEEWKTDRVYATDANGETYTNANGDKVTVQQTMPVVTQVIDRTRFVFDDKGNAVTNKDGSYATEVQTVAVTKYVFDDDGNKVMQNVKDENGNDVTEVIEKEDGKTETVVVTEPVTELHTEKVTSVIEVTVHDQHTHYQTYPKNTTEKTTSIYENPAYTRTEPTTKRPNKVTFPETGNLAARQRWLKGFGGTQDDKYRKVLAVDTNSFIALGQTFSVNGTFESFSQAGFYTVFTKFDSDGNVIWHCPIGTTGFTRMHDFAILTDGSIIAVGETNAADLGFENESKSYHPLMVKLSADGTVLWYKTFGTVVAEYFTSVDAMPDGGYVAGGKFVTDAKEGDTILDFKTNALTAKFNSEGENEWTAVFGGSGNDWVNALAADAAGNIYAACHTNSKDGDAKGSDGSTDVAVVKYAPDGTRLWVKFLKGSKTEEVEDIYADETGCVFVGRYASADGVFTLNRGSYDAYMARCSADGSLEWVKTYGGLKGERLYSVIPTAYGFAATGISYSSNRDFKDMGNLGGYDAFIMSVDKSGNLQNIKPIAGTGNDGCYDICMLYTDHYIIVGETYKNDKLFADITPAAGDKNSTAFVAKYEIN